MENLFRLNSSFFQRIRHGNRFMFADVSDGKGHLFGFPRFKYAGLNVRIESLMLRQDFWEMTGKIPVIVVATSKDNLDDIKEVADTFDRVTAVCGVGDSFTLINRILANCFEQAAEETEK